MVASGVGYISLVNDDWIFVTVTLEIHTQILDGPPEHIVRTVTENGRTLKFGQGFEREWPVRPEDWLA